MRFVCLVYHEQSVLDGMSEAEMRVCVDDSLAYDRELEERGHMVVAHALQPVGEARSVKMRKGQKHITDGPFAETKEQLIGFILIEAASREEAVEIAAGIPMGRTGTIEVRPVMGL
ncbi:YciI family protein [Nitratireductor mangrovi]|uniref:YciI family protein n=1 Tax=Nitratireductor mangrovi TaxID=2599600 RepID=A0A5B8L5Q5_9HYPH|nr:YciI family protein [Nitratireductor mangrovi]QDZ03112.1 YciI family protein [Nitratireductor mangrovi]